MGSTPAKKKPPPRAAAEGRGGREDAHRRESVRAFVGRLVGDPTLAEDLTQEAFARAHRSRSAFRGEASETSWLCAIALNVVRDHFRAAARLPDLAGDEGVLFTLRDDRDLEKDLLEREMASCIREYLLRLPDAQRDVVALHDVAGLTHREVGLVFGISEGHSRVLLHRGRSALKALLKDNCVLSFNDDALPCERKPVEKSAKKPGTETTP